MGSSLLQAVLGGNSSPSADDINKILSSVGIEADSDRVEGLLKELEGKDITEVIASGVSKLASVPAGGCAVAASGGRFSCLATPVCPVCWAHTTPCVCFSYVVQDSTAEELAM